MPAESSDATNRPGISEDDAHRLLARAAELDAHIGTTLSVAQLRDIAAEAGIGKDAFEAALREYLAHNQTPSIHGGPLDDARRAARGRLVERFARHRALAAFAILLGAALASPGDFIWTTVLVSTPLYALYELGIAIGRSRTRPPAMPPLPPASPTDDANGSPPRTPPRTPPSAPADRTIRNLLLRSA